jgi:hypothetical protein
MIEGAAAYAFWLLTVLFDAFAHKIITNNNNNNE